MEIEAPQKKEEIPLFWDHAKQCWRHKNLDLKRVPMKYRCPSCGKIVFYKISEVLRKTKKRKKRGRG